MDQTPFSDGFSVKLQAWGQRSGWTDAALVIAANLEDLGIQVQVEPLEDAVAIANLRSGGYEMQFSGLAAGPMNFFRSQWIPGAFWTEALRYHNPDVIRLVNSASVAIDFRPESRTHPSRSGTGASGHAARPDLGAGGSGREPDRPEDPVRSQPPARHQSHGGNPGRVAAGLGPIFHR